MDTEVTRDALAWVDESETVLLAAPAPEIDITHLITNRYS
ncbi:hypothetical protein BN903_58 [Halorubrum sp. AJ67]|nr:hypothetical protein BN903_58 [Halorubrum sp. AJ67]